MGVYRLELAKSARALCKNAECKNSGVKIGKGELRWCTLVTIKENQSWQYKHWGCVTPKQIANLKETIEDDLDLLDGYDELDTESQDKVKEALANGHIDDADWTGDPEQNRPGKNGFRSPKKTTNPGTEDAGDEYGTPSLSKPSKKKRGRANKQDEEEDAADTHEQPAKKAKKTPAKGKNTRDDDALEEQTVKKGRAKRQKVKDQTKNEELYLKEEDSDHNTVPDFPQKRNRRTQKSVASKEFKANDDDPSVGDEANGNDSNLRQGRKKAAPSNIEDGDGDNDPEKQQEAYKPGKASQKAAVVKKAKVQAKSNKPVGSKGVSAGMDDIEPDIDFLASDAIAAAPIAKKAAKKGAKKAAPKAT